MNIKAEKTTEKLVINGALLLCMSSMACLLLMKILHMTGTPEMRWLMLIPQVLILGHIIRTHNAESQASGKAAVAACLTCLLGSILFALMLHAYFTATAPLHFLEIRSALPAPLSELSAIMLSAICAAEQTATGLLVTAGIVQFNRVYRGPGTVFHPDRKPA